MTDIPLHVSADKRSVTVAADTVVQWRYRGQLIQREIPAGYEARPGAGVLTLMILGLLTYPYALLKASVLHDYLYDEMERAPTKAVPRAAADAAILADDDDPRWLQLIAYYIVRMIGWVPWLR